MPWVSKAMEYSMSSDMFYRLVQLRLEAETRKNSSEFFRTLSFLRAAVHAATLAATDARLEWVAARHLYSAELILSRAR